MTPKRFSKRSLTFDDWDRRAGNTAYANSIRRVHAFYPKATLSQLRGIPRTGEKPLGGLRKVPLSKLPWEVLSPQEKSKRERSLQVLGMVRDGKDFSHASREVGIRPQTVLRHTGVAIVRRKGKFVPRRIDRISRGLIIYEDGEQRSIVVNDSKQSSKVGRYYNAVRTFLNTGVVSGLAQFRHVRVRDSKGVRHTLETRPRKILDIEDRREEPEFFTIYDL